MIRRTATGPLPLTRAQTLALLLLLCTHSALLAYGAWVHSPAWDEVGHFAAGLSHWQTGQYEFYRVNPPLVRMWATLPISFAIPKITVAASAETERPEFVAGPALIRALGPTRTQWAFAIARWFCIPFSLIGALVCFHWARQMFGTASGFIALWTWCFDPNILANAQMITPDTAAASFGVLACYSFWRYLKSPSTPLACIVGMLTGLALLTKATWVCLAVIYPLMWSLVCIPHRIRPVELSRTLRDALLSAAISLLVLNMGYRFDGSGTQVKHLDFKSHLLTSQGENRFANSLLGDVYLPLPAQFVLGIDRQKMDFESNFISYLRGEWKSGGWWYYYLYGLGVKTPVATLMLCAWATFALVRYAFRTTPGPATRHVLAALSPGVFLLCFVSAQTGFSHHLRYVLPAFPSLFLLLSLLGHRWTQRAFTSRVAVVALLTLGATESVYHYPHSLSFYNVLVGGPDNGHEHMLDSNTEWGQDLYFLREWLRENPQARPCYSVHFGILDAQDLGCPTAGWPPPGYAVDDSVDLRTIGPLPGWYAIGVTALHGDSRPDRDLLLRQGVPLCGYFRFFEPVDRVGYSILIYHLTPETVNPVRRQLGLPTVDWSQ